MLFPFDTEKEFGAKGRMPVKATFDGVPYQDSLIKYSKPQHMLGVLKGIREQIGKGSGDTIEVVIWRDEEVRTSEVPAQFKALLKKKGLLPFFEQLSYTQPQGVLPLDYGRQKRRNTLAATRASHCDDREEGSAIRSSRTHE